MPRVLVSKTNSKHLQFACAEQHFFCLKCCGYIITNNAVSPQLNLIWPVVSNIKYFRRHLIIRSGQCEIPDLGLSFNQMSLLSM